MFYLAISHVATAIDVEGRKREGRYLLILIIFISTVGVGGRAKIELVLPFAYLSLHTTHRQIQFLSLLSPFNSPESDMDPFRRVETI